MTEITYACCPKCGNEMKPLSYGLNDYGIGCFEYFVFKPWLRGDVRRYGAIDTLHEKEQK